MITGPKAARAALGGLVLALAAARPLDAAPRDLIPVPGRSEVTFAATFPLGNFTGRAGDIGGQFRADPADLRQGVTGALRVRVTSLRTGVDGRDRDMLRLLASARYPEIVFTLERAEASFASITDRADVLLTLHGVMSIRGVDRPMTFPGRARFREDKLWVRGESELRLSDFGMTPPSRFFFRVRDRLLVGFDVTLAAE